MDKQEELNKISELEVKIIESRNMIQCLKKENEILFNNILWSFHEARK